MQEPDRFASPAYRNVLDLEHQAGVCHVTAAALRAMCTSCEHCYPLEACGLLIGRITPDGWHIDEARAVANLNSERAADRFQLDPDAYRATDQALHGTDREIVGVYHSHPDCPARPSPTDLENAWGGLAYIIVSVYEKNTAELRCWALNARGDRFQPSPITEIS